MFLSLKNHLKMLVSVGVILYALQLRAGSGFLDYKVMRSAQSTADAIENYGEDGRFWFMIHCAVDIVLFIPIYLSFIHFAFRFIFGGKVPKVWVGAYVLAGLCDCLEQATSMFMLRIYPQISEETAVVSAYSTTVKCALLAFSTFGIVLASFTPMDGLERAKKE